MKQTNNATTWALSVFDSDMPPAEKLICLYLRTHMNDYREMAWPSVGRIADKCSLSVRSVQGHLKGIQNSGYLLINGHGPKGTHRYEICAPAESAPPQKTTLPPAESAPELTKELTNTLSKGFKRPTLEEVKAYCVEKGYRFDAEVFINYYDSNGWKVGRNSMKNWKSAVANWSKREKQSGPGSNGRGNSSAVETIRAEDLLNQGYVNS